MVLVLFEEVVYVTDAVDRCDDAGRPNPDTVNTPADFVDALRRLLLWTGLSLRQLDKRAKAAGYVLARSTVANVLARATLPREDFVVAFVLVCGCDQDDVRRWIATRRRIAAGTADPGPLGQHAKRPNLILAALGIVLAVAALTMAADAGNIAPRSLTIPPSVPAGVPKVLYVGDSLAMETRDMVALLVNVTGKAKVVSVAHSDPAICDYLADRSEPSLSVPMEHKLPTLVAEVKPRVIVLQFWGNSGVRTPCTGGAQAPIDDYYRRYRADAQQVVQQVDQAAREADIPRPKLVGCCKVPTATNRIGSADLIRKSRQSRMPTVIWCQTQVGR